MTHYETTTKSNNINTTTPRDFNYINSPVNQIKTISITSQCDAHAGLDVVNTEAALAKCKCLKVTKSFQESIMSCLKNDFPQEIENSYRKN